MKYMNKFENETSNGAEMMSEKGMKTLTMEEMAYVVGGEGEDGDAGQQQNSETSTESESRRVSQARRLLNRRRALERFRNIVLNS